MTESEAIEELKCYMSCSGTAYPEEIEVAINAIEKQIPKKPIVDSSKYGLIDDYYCPVCNSYIRSIATRIEVILEENIFCGVCGQKLNWESDGE